MARTRALSVAATLLLAAPAAAHVAPSPDVNNRYVKATLLPDAVRVAYLIYFGEKPGAGERRRMDSDGNGTIDPAEARAFGERLRDEIAPAVVILLDGRKVQAEWTVADVGLGSTPAAAGNAFSVDLILRAPLMDPSAEQHTLVIDDSWQVPAAGEAEIRVEESPGVRALEVRKANERPGTNVELSHLFAGNSTKMADGSFSHAVVARFAVDASLRKAPPLIRRAWLPLVLIVCGIVIGVSTLAFALWRWNRRNPGA